MDILPKKQEKDLAIWLASCVSSFVVKAMLILAMLISGTGYTLMVWMTCKFRRFVSRGHNRCACICPVELFSDHSVRFFIDSFLLIHCSVLCWTCCLCKHVDLNYCLFIYVKAMLIRNMPLPMFDCLQWLTASTLLCYVQVFGSSISFMSPDSLLLLDMIPAPVFSCTLYSLVTVILLRCNIHWYVVMYCWAHAIRLVLCVKPGFLPTRSNHWNTQVLECSSDWMGLVRPQV